MLKRFVFGASIAAVSAIFPAHANPVKVDKAGMICGTNDSFDAALRVLSDKAGPDDKTKMFTHCLMLEAGDTLETTEFNVQSGRATGRGTYSGKDGTRLGQYLLLEQTSRPIGTVAALPTDSTPKKLSAADMGVQTRKWQGKTIETRMSCFYADKDEFRCTTRSARVDFSSITPPEARRRVEDDCDTIEKSSRARCTFTVRFVWRDSEMRPLGLSRLHMITAESDAGEIVLPPAAKRK